MQHLFKFAQISNFVQIWQLCNFAHFSFFTFHAIVHWPITLRVEPFKNIRQHKKWPIAWMVAWLAKICNFNRTSICLYKFCLYKYKISYMTERTKLTVPPANIQISFCMNPDKSEYLLYTEWVYEVINVRQSVFHAQRKGIHWVDRSFSLVLSCTVCSRT